MWVQVRVTCPPELTAAVTQVLMECDGFAHLAVHPGVSTHPPGDVLVADVARESLDGVLQGLSALGVPEVGAVSVSTPQVLMSGLAEEASARAPGDAADAVVWEEVAFAAEADAGLTTAFCLLLVAAAWIAAIGILTDSLVLIVGAMVLGPEYAPLAALATGLALRSGQLCRRALRTIVLGTVVAVATTALFVAGLAILGIAHLDDRSHEATGFIARPDIWSLLVALIAGAGGAVSATARRSGALVGVLISVTTIPAMAQSAVALASGEFDVALAAAVQLAINMVGIIVGSTLVLEVHRRRRGLPVGESVAAPG